MTSKVKNEVLCRDCGRSLWDPAGEDGKIYFECGAGCVPDKVMAVSTARKFLVADCPMPRECRRHGTGPGTFTVFDIASGMRPDRVQNDPPPRTHTEPSGDPARGPRGIDGDPCGTGRRPQDGARARPPDMPDPVSCMLRKRNAERRRNEEQRTLEWCFGRGPSPNRPGGANDELS